MILYLQLSFLCPGGMVVISALKQKYLFLSRVLEVSWEMNIPKYFELFLDLKILFTFL